MEVSEINTSYVNPVKCHKDVQNTTNEVTIPHPNEG